MFYLRLRALCSWFLFFRPQELVRHGGVELLVRCLNDDEVPVPYALLCFCHTYPSSLLLAPTACMPLNVATAGGRAIKDCLLGALPPWRGARPHDGLAGSKAGSRRRCVHECTSGERVGRLFSRRVFRNAEIGRSCEALVCFLHAYSRSTHSPSVFPFAEPASTRLPACVRARTHSSACKAELSSAHLFQVARHALAFACAQAALHRSAHGLKRVRAACCCETDRLGRQKSFAWDGCERARALREGNFGGGVMGASVVGCVRERECDRRCA
eukprot:1401775-Pleurochrysis_carterae.AAC.2